MAAREWVHRSLKNIRQMSERYDPWDMAYELSRGYYSREQIDEMLLCEIEEIIYQEDE